MTLDEMKLAVCEKLPKLVFIRRYTDEDKPYWIVYWMGRGINVYWPTEGLQVCHEAEKLMSNWQKQEYGKLLQETSNEAVVGYVPDYYANLRGLANIAHATYEQRLEALCRVWFSERFNT